MNRSRYSKNVSGFTLTEMIMVMIIIGILAGIAIPSFFTWMPNYQLRRAARDLYSSMQRSKMEAIKGNQPVVFSFSPAPGNTYQATLSGITVVMLPVNLTDYGYGIQFGSGSATVSADPPQALPGNGVPGTYTSTTFDTRGNVNNLGYVYITNSRRSVYAVGTPMMGGVIRIRKWAAPSWD